MRRSIRQERCLGRCSSLPLAAGSAEKEPPPPPPPPRRAPVLERARALWAEQHADLAGRVQFVEGDFFHSVPAGKDL